jgi:hypothetical protein
MFKEKLFSMIACFSFLALASAKAENLAPNASFEEEYELKKQVADTLIQKGFKLDPKRWAKGWIINDATIPCEISIVEEAGAPDGNKFIRIKTKGPTHLYTTSLIPGKNPLKLSFSAKGQEFEGKKPSIKLILYKYKLDGAWYGNNYSAGEYVPNLNWQAFSVEVPVLGDDVQFKVAFAIEGECDIDNLNLEKRLEN